jgi:hypothetical protein
LLIISPSEKPVESVWDKGWIQKHREKAQMGLSESKPHPTTEGIVAEIKTETYDYWTINRNGDFYSLISLFEDYRKKPENIFFDTRIVRITEVLLYCAKLYSFLGVDTNKKVFFSIRHSGLENRTLIAANQSRRLRKDYKSLENEVDTTIEFTLNQIESDLVQLVQKITDPLFTLFDFFQLADSVYEDIVNKFVKGQM